MKKYDKIVAIIRDYAHSKKSTKRRNPIIPETNDLEMGMLTLAILSVVAKSPTPLPIQDIASPIALILDYPIPKTALALLYRRIDFLIANDYLTGEPYVKEGWKHRIVMGFSVTAKGKQLLNNSLTQIEQIITKMRVA